MAAESILKVKIVKGVLYVGCPLCNEALPLKTTKHGRPYFVCRYCGLRVFINYQAGQDRLFSLFKAKYGDRSPVSPKKGEVNQDA